MPTNKKQTMLNGALTLVFTTLIVKVIGVLYKIPLTAMLGEVGLGYFSSAYDVYTPIVSISMAGIPIAVAKMVSQDVALHRYRNARQTYRVSFRLFMIIGVVGTAVMLLLAYPYAVWISKSPNTLYSILAIAPAVFFCCAMSIYRGYYEGLSNMVPTGVSQVIEALGKLVLGLILSYAVIRVGKHQFAAGGAVFGKTVQNLDEAMAEIYPYAAAAAVMGVTLGTMFGMLYLALRHKIKGDGFTRTDLVNSPKPLSGQEIAKMMMALAIPVVASSLITNVTNIIDAGMLRARLADIMGNPESASVMKTMYAESLIGTGTPDGSVTDYLYGCYSAAINFKNLVPMITMNFGVSALPILSAAWATKDHKTSRVTIESVLRLTLLIGLPAGIGMAVLAEPILMLLYGSRPYLVPVAVPIMKAYGYSTALMALSAPITNMLQAIGRTDVPVKSLLIGAAIKIVGNYVLVGIPTINIQGAPYASILCYIIVVALNLYFLLHVSKVRINVTSVFFKPAFCSIVCGVAAFTSYGILSKLLENIWPKDGLMGVSMLSSGNFSALVAIIIAIAFYVVALLFSRAISKDDVVMLPKGEKIAKILEKYGLIG
uniref:putative polysaccharide biosynthesis protein n=1 Tax=Candidatus Fimivicinus sp. TaxID=3056640 RepID=UPI003FEF29A7